MTTRRSFLGLGSLAALAALALPSLADEADYQPGLVKRLLDEGRVVWLDFYADWCSTCRTQRRVIEALRAENPDYDRRIVFVTVDWDRWKGGELARELGVSRRSTLVVLAPEGEIGRIVAGTSRAQIKALMDNALLAAEG